MSSSRPSFNSNPSSTVGFVSSGTTTRTTLIVPLLPYMAGLSLLDFNQLINDPICYYVGWPAILTKLPSNIAKLEGLAGEDPTNHVQSFHMWCSSNSITDDSIRLRLFQCTLTGEASKWYVDQTTSSYTTFATIAQAFLSYFQLPFRYDTSTELLTSFKQTSLIRLSAHVQEWR